MSAKSCFTLEKVRTEFESWRANVNVIRRMPKTEDQLKRRRPTRHASAVLGDRRAIGGFVNPQSLSCEPGALGRDEKPLETTGVLIRVAELPAHPRAAAIDHPLLRNEKVA